MKLKLISLCFILLAGVAHAEDGLKGKAAEAVDPDCTPSKAVKGAAMKATVGVGKRCDVAETARDVTGVDGKAKEVQDKLPK